MLGVAGRKDYKVNMKKSNFFYFLTDYGFYLFAIQFIFITINLLVWDTSRSPFYVSLNFALKSLPTIF